MSENRKAVTTPQEVERIWSELEQEADSMPTDTEEHVRKYGHAALYARHECKECGFEWHCRQPVCKLANEGVLCRACEVEALLSEILNISDALLPAMDHEIWTPTSADSVLWAKSLMLVLKPRLEALRDDALRITQMERI